MAVLFVFGVSACAPAWADDLDLQVGEVRVLSVPQVARVAVGDGHVMHAVATDEEEVIVFARNEGSSALQIWTRDGHRRTYQVMVAPEGTRKAQEELRSLLSRIPQARVTVTGDKLIVEGDDLTDDDRVRIAELARRYPQLVDLTGQVGWESMVLFDVQVVEIPRSQFRDIGMRWSSPLAGGMHVGGTWDAGSGGLSARPGDNPLSFPLQPGVAAGYFGINAMLTSRIQAMAQQGEAVVLAQPQLLARSGATAEFLAGGEVPYATTDKDGDSRTVFKPYGVSLRITPQVERNGVVRARIEVEVSAVDQSLSVSTGPSLKTRKAATEFNVRSGQTLVLAGFLSREAAMQRDGLPGLSRIPLLGHLFGSSRHQRNETELAIFVTPQLVSADHPGMDARLRNGQGILQEMFPHPPRLNTSIGDHTSLPAVVSHAEASAWNPWEGPGTQWFTDSKAAMEQSVVGRNEYLFTE
nr:pilus assembly protein N-terminal domain-containing protein [Allopusillimonas ginsengisoli]